MSDGVQLVLWIAGVHLIGFVCVAVLMLPALRENSDGTTDPLDEGEDGWGRGPKAPPPTPPAPPRGGVPLPDAIPATVSPRVSVAPSANRPGRRCAPTSSQPVEGPAAEALGPFGRQLRSVDGPARPKAGR
jgi:hypothetical protein